MEYLHPDTIKPEPPKDNRTFIVIPYRSLKDPTMSYGRMRVLMAICSYARKTGEAWPGVQRIADDTGYTLSTVSQHITQLTKRGYLKTVRNSYTVGMKAKPRLVIYDPDQEPDADGWEPAGNQENLMREPESIRETKESISQPLADATSLFVCWRTLMQQRYNITPPDEPTLYRRLTYRYTLESFKEAARDHLSATSAPPPSVGVLVR
jgi:DNA-binding transcriptional MocR family regulator